MKTANGKVVLVTGASSGIGYETAARLLEEGFKVYGAARRVEKMEPLGERGLVPMKMDVTDEESIKKGVEEIIRAEGRIDVLVNNAGYGYFGAIENVPLDEARKQMEVNVFGLAAVTKAVLPHMRAGGCGRIINISSIAGRAVFYLGGWYHVSKYSVEALSDALRMELRPFGMDVVIIEPGGIKTAWGGIAADHLEESSKGTAYERPALREADTFRKAYSSNLLAPPSRVSRLVLRAVRARRPRARYRTGTGAGASIFFHALLPARWWDALMRLAGRIKL